jgi:hypothetical protein
MATLVNGISYNYASIKINLLGVEPKGIRSINYAAARATQHYYGVGDKPVALGYGNLTFNASFEIQFEDVQAFRDAVRATSEGDITKLAPFDISVSFGNAGQIPKTHTLKQCVFLDDGVQGSTGDGTFVMSYNILPADIIFSQ